MQQDAEPFRPLRPASRRLIGVALVLGPGIWLIAIAIVAALAHRTNVIGFGLLVAFAASLVSALVLVVLRRRRLREEVEAANRR